MIHPFIITGMLRWSPSQDFFIAADDGEQWLLDVPRDLIEEVDRLVYDQVMAEGGRKAISTMAIRQIWLPMSRRRALRRIVADAR